MKGIPLLLVVVDNTGRDLSRLAQTSSSFSPGISSRLNPGLLLTGIVNTQHGRPPLQAHFVCETASSSSRILHETRLALSQIQEVV
jgi:hypothetical protein